jgi:hypothetical protein
MLSSASPGTHLTIRDLLVKLRDVAYRYDHSKATASMASLWSKRKEQKVTYPQLLGANPDIKHLMFSLRRCVQQVHCHSNNRNQ